MSNVFGGGSNPNNELFGVKVNSSDLGKPLTVIMGTAKTNQLIFWVDGFKQSPDGGKKGGGGGKGGGKGGQYVYSADIVAGLCAGPISGIGDVWTGQSWLGSPKANESYTIAGPSYTYTPTNATGLTNNFGVSPASTYSGSYIDYSAPSSTAVSNTTSSAFTQLAYGATLTTGTYSINPTTNAYYFSSADVGKTVLLSYSFLLTTINNQETDLIPSGKTISVAPANTFEADLGVVYAVGSPYAGQAFTRISGTPTVAKTYSLSGNMPAVYKFATADIGAAVTITFQVQNLSAVGQNESTMLDFTLAEGNIGQTPFSFLSASYPDAALGYSGAATVLYEPMDLGVGGEIQQISFEVITPDRMGGTYADGTPVLDCNPVHCMTRVLTDTQWGLGVGAQPFPTSFIDNGSGGTWGAPGTPSVQSVGATAWNWFAANNFLISPVIDSQDSADSTISKWLEAGMCAAFVSEGLLKLVPYGDTSAAANGCTWTAPTSFVVALDDTCFLAKEGTDPVTIKRSPWQDAFNEVQVQWDNRNNQYAKEVTAESDQSLINRYGSRIEDPQNWDFICTLPAATFAANLRLKHGTYIRNTYEFSLPFNYSYLEPMDIVTITTSSVWAQGINNTNLGVTNLPIRITKVVDDPKEGIKIEAEDYPYGAGQPTLFNKGLSSAEPISNIYASPGTSEVVLFEAAGRLVGFGGNQIWMGAAGTSTDYGSTNVWVSQDNVTYVQVAQLTQPSVIGELASTFASGSDPDTTNSLVVQLAENSAQLSSGTTTAADNDTMLCYVDGEIVSYSAAAITGQNTWTLNGYIRRGQLGSTISSHAAGSLFMRLDGTVFKYTYDPTWQGKTVYFKFQAVNSFGNNPQPLSNLSAVSFNIGSTNSGAVDASTGLVLQGSISGLTATISTIDTNITTAQTTATTAQTTATAAQTTATAASTLLADLSSTSYLTNSDKITLMAQWSAEQATKTSLDSLATTWSVSSTAYDSAVSAISSNLITAGAPSNWATTWPDGTTSGPWTGIQTNLANLWASVATQRTSLQSAISSAQASAAQIAAVATSVAAASGLVPASVSTLPTLPSSSYPAGKLVWLTTTNVLYVSSGTTWTPNGAVAGSITGTITGSQIAASTITSSQIQAGAIGAAQIAANSITASQIAANTITAGQIASGAITASMITTGTLDASVVNVTNLNASDITTGTLSASKVLFGDGTSVSTASRLITGYASLASQQVLYPASTWQAVTGMSFSVTVHSTADTFNLFQQFFFDWGGGSGTLSISLYLDGTAYKTWTGASGGFPVIPFVYSLTGLSAGSHTLAYYAESSVLLTHIDVPTNVMCQQIY